MKTNYLLISLLLFLPACSHQFGSFEHDVGEAPYPWTNKPPLYDPEAVRFAVFSDLTGGERPGVFEQAVEQMNLLRPELIFSVGDLIEVGDDPVVINQRWDSFDERAGKATAPVFYVGGNHDLLGEELQTIWSERNGSTYYHVRYRDVLFLIFDAEDHAPARKQEIFEMRKVAYEVAKTDGWDAFAKTDYAKHPEDLTGMISQEQADYMLRVLRENEDVLWTFLIVHKAPWANEDMETWKALESEIADRPYTVFHGHRHAYKHAVRNGRDYIQLAPTGGVLLPNNGPSMDQIAWVTVDKGGAHIVNLKVSGIFDKTGPTSADEH